MRMSWAANRRTTRGEDIAYCLMGLFGVNMPLLYGEGSKAFLRLQEEILRIIDDDTIFAWSEPFWSRFEGIRGIFALSPAFFLGARELVVIPSMEPDSHFVNTSKGLRTNTTVCPTWEMLKEKLHVLRGVDNSQLHQSFLLLPLNCARNLSSETHAAILLQWQHDRTYLCVPSTDLFEVKYDQVSRDSTVFVAKSDMFYRRAISEALDRNLVNFVFQLPDTGVTFLQRLSPATGKYRPVSSSFAMQKDVAGKLGFTFYLENSKQLLLVAIEFSESPLNLVQWVN
ncbi:hypothetical protein PG996_010607 [Apiospora saccharicola]|uniref:DUF8212 domain-containing protein n=1 Tax=Apiospora saccharicola TaxID=335842 RepID=A0ABR1UP24_9PEZI